jgi:ferritin-like protein
MAQASTTFHEREETLQPGTIERHRALVSLMEELEAVDWYDQRIDATRDEELRAVLAHNRDEEKEHAAMTLEWLRRRDAEFDRQLRNYLFTDKPILEVEEEVDEKEAEDEAAADAAAGSLGLGSLRGTGSA